MKKSNLEGEVMNSQRKSRISSILRLAGLAFMVSALSNCDLPFGPRWDADLYMPITDTSFPVSDFLPANYIPSGISARISSTPQRYDLGAARDLLKNLVTDSLANMVFYVTLGKKLGVSAYDTVFVSPDSAAIESRDSNWIAFPLYLSASDTMKQDSLAVPQESIEMIKDAADNGTPLWIQTSGQFSTPEDSPVTVSPSDSLSVKASMLARISVSR